MAFIVRVKVKPSSGSNRVVKRKDDMLYVEVREPPEGGRANRALVKLLAKEFNVDVSRVKIISGSRSRIKMVKIYKD